MFVHTGEHMFGRILITAALVLFLWATFARTSHATGPEVRYTVQPTDTLWSIAASRYGDPREGVYELRRRNDLHGTTIVPGQVIVIPG